MKRQSSAQAISSLHLVSQHLGQLSDQDCDHDAVDALKRIVENHIGALEILETLAADPPQREQRSGKSPANRHNQRLSAANRVANKA